MAPTQEELADLEPHTGNHTTPDARYELENKDGALVLSYELHPDPAQVRPATIPDVPPDKPVEFVAEDLALVSIAGLSLPLIFVRDDAGEIGWISASLRLIPKAAA